MNPTDDCLLKSLLAEKRLSYGGGIYRYTQVAFAYHSCAIDGGELTYEQVESLYDAYTVPTQQGDVVSVGDIMTAFNHFALFDVMLEGAKGPLTEEEIKNYHSVLKRGTIDERRRWFAVGDYKRLPNEVGGMDTTAPENVGAEMKKLLAEYNAIESKTFDDLLDFHYRFERIHPFQDGNGRVGRLLLFKECLRNNIVPFIIEDDIKMFYYRGLKEWQNERGYLRDTCLAAQDRFKKYLDYFRVPYDK